MYAKMSSKLPVHKEAAFGNHCKKSLNVMCNTSILCNCLNKIKSIFFNSQCVCVCAVTNDEPEEEENISHPHMANSVGRSGHWGLKDSVMFVSPLQRIKKQHPQNSKHQNLQCSNIWQQACETLEVAVVLVVDGLAFYSTNQVNSESSLRVGGS